MTKAQAQCVAAQIAEEINRAWTGKRATPIPVMPDIIPYNSVTSDKVTLGLTSYEVYPIGFNFNACNQTKCNFLLVNSKNTTIYLKDTLKLLIMF